MEVNGRYKKIAVHWGHPVNIVGYGAKLGHNQWENMAIECEDCNEIIADETWIEPKETDNEEKDDFTNTV
jgi:hypothetical protein